MANEERHVDARTPGEQLDEARRRFTSFAEKAGAELRPGSPAAGPLLDGLALLTEALGGALTRVDDDAARVVEEWHSDLNWTVREGAAATGARDGERPAAVAAEADGPLEAVRRAREAAEAARDAANATIRARQAAHRAWEVKEAEVAAARAAEQQALTAEEEARSAKEEAQVAREAARAADDEARTARKAAQVAREAARAAEDQARTADDEARAEQRRARTAEQKADAAKAARAGAEAARQQAEAEAENHRQEQEHAEAELERARLRAAEAQRHAEEAARAAGSAEDEAATAELAAAERRKSRAAAEERARQAADEADQEDRRRTEAEEEAVRAEIARDEARRARFQRELQLTLADVWDRYQDPHFAFGTEPPPTDGDTAALWTRGHLALLRLGEADRLREMSVLAALARRCGLDPGPGTPAESGPAEPGERVPSVVAVPELPGYEVEEVRLSTDVPGWAELADDERGEVTELLRSALSAEPEDRSGERLAVLLDSPQDDDLLLTVLLRIWQADRLLALDSGLGHWQDARTRRWIRWERKDFRKKAVRSLTLLASVYPEPVEGWGWARPEDAEFAVNWVHSLDAVLGFHHQAPALVDSWWWRWRLALAGQLGTPPGGRAAGPWSTRANSPCCSPGPAPTTTSSSRTSATASPRRSSGSPHRPWSGRTRRAPLSVCARAGWYAGSDVARPVRRAGTRQARRVGPARPPGTEGPSGDGRADPLVRAVTALAGLPLARACGLGAAPAEDLAALTAGRDPSLRVALSGAEPAVRTLTAALHGRLPADAVRLDARPVDGHLLLHVIHDGWSPVPGTPAGPDPECPAPGLSELLIRPGAPRASVVVVAVDDWGALGLDSVAGWNGNRLCSWPAPWQATEVRAVIPHRAAERPQSSGIDRLVGEVLAPALEQRRSLVARLTRERLTRALRLVARTAQDVSGAPHSGTSPAEAWLRLQAGAAGPSALRLLRLLDGRADRDGRDGSSERSNRDERDGEAA